MAYTTRLQIVQGALNLVSSTPLPSTSVYQAPEITSGLNRLERLIEEECEAFIYPFAIHYFKLENPVVSARDYNADINSIYLLPKNVARIVGVFYQDNLPPLVNIAFPLNYALGFRSGFKYDLVSAEGDSLIKISPNPVNDQPDKEVYLVYMTKAPLISNMFSSFQNMLVYLLASEFHMAIGTNSRILFNIQFQANKSRRVARTSAIKGFSNFNRIIVSLDQILESGKPDGC